MRTSRLHRPATRLAWLAIVLAALSACTSHTMTTPAPTAPSSPPVSPQAQASSPGAAAEVRGAVRVVPVVIDSVAERSLGEALGIQDAMANLDALIAVHIRAIEAPGMRFEPEILPPPSEAPAGGFHIRVVKAYVNRVMETKSGVVVLALTGPRGTVHFRAQTTGFNWMSSRSEFYGAIRNALHLALEQLTPHLTTEAAETVAPSDSSAP